MMRFSTFLVEIFIVQATIDLNIRELQYITYELTFYECKLLSEALDKTTFFLEEPLTGRDQLRNETCLERLLRWDRTVAKGKTFNDLVRRLRQIGRKDIADKLSKNVYHEEAAELKEKFLDDPFASGIATDSVLLDNDSTKSKFTAVDGNNDSYGIWPILTLVCAGFSVVLLVIVSVRRFCPVWCATTWRKVASDSLLASTDFCWEETTLCCRRLNKHYEEVVIGKKKTTCEGSVDVEYSLKVNLLDENDENNEENEEQASEKEDIRSIISALSRLTNKSKNELPEL